MIPVTSMLRTLALAGLFIFVATGAGIAGGVERQGSQAPAGPAMDLPAMLGCALGEQRSAIDVRYVNPAQKLSPCNFHFNFTPRSGGQVWRTVPVDFGFGAPDGTIALDAKTLALAKAGSVSGLGD